jgi:hypothetical protein
LKAKFQLAISGVPPFKSLYDKLQNGKIPSQAVMHDLLQEAKVPAKHLQECADTFIVNAKNLGLLKTLSGAERLVPIEQVLDEMPSHASGKSGSILPSQVHATVPQTLETSDWKRICFYIAPIGEEGSEYRRHSDLFLNNIVEPALRDTGLKIIRADQIGKPGMIGAQVIEHVIHSGLVVADLSFHNPNVFYELSLRHACGLPTVQIIRKADEIPFDTLQSRTISIDTTDIYALVPKLEIIRAEISTQVRSALEGGESSDNPITTFCPGLRVSLPDVKGEKKSLVQ